MTSGFYNYAKIIVNSTNYAKRMARLSSKIFGEVSRPTDNKSMKVVKLLARKPVEQLPEFNHYYPPHDEHHYLMKTLRFHGLYRDEHQDFRDEMNRLRALRGKAPPKRGEGKRALQKKA